MTDSKICSFCKNEVSAQTIVCPHCGHHFNTTDDAVSNKVFQPTQRIQAPFRLLMAVSCAVMIIGSLMPWGMMNTMLGSFPIHGAEGDGVLTAGIGAVLILVAFLPDQVSKNRRLAFIAGSVLGFIILIPKLFWFRADPDLVGSGLSSQLYPGLILAVAGVFFVLASALITHKKEVPL